ncbi:HoxN/HupN/NixA family nickel/cobalt transporter [Celerinatantimonas diazotrophica]|uniref:HoxN/HupN/NixA family nickel/cobalt transporter n=1 Tax=Celerinatantimonas diazotrophica TaxID=412034 RepID=UPI001A9D6487|nr:HoxN/HupN/NixA family nickel/cobalt transporter [Celerinatantimonas diazotrophica]
MVSHTVSIRTKGLLLLSSLSALNLVIWIWAFITFNHHPALIGTALLAWTYGLRHAVDADHIAAIDNVTRKMMQQDKEPVAVGAFFSLGHSTIVVLASILVGVATSEFSSKLSWFQDVGGTIGTTVSALFLLLLAFINFLIFKDILKKFRQVKKGNYQGIHTAIDEPLGGGIMTWLYRRLFRFINHSWQMYLVGFLFGLGFDTATEVGLLAISAASSSHGLPLSSILIFPALFAAGMALIDSVDNVIMVKAYGWAFEQPFRKLYYNLTITASSLIIAFVIGGFEALGILAEKGDWQSGFSQWIENANSHLGNIGFWIVGIMIACWLCSLLNYRLRGYHKLTFDHSNL